MRAKAGIRGNVNVALNRLVQGGIITGFKTTFGTDTGPGAPGVTITVPEGRSPVEVRERVMNALADVVVGINVTVEPSKERHV
jgi:hypothetical protein